MVNDALDLVEKEFHPDHSHRYITGLSQGGCGTFELAAHCSWRFAAAAPICGFTDRLDLGADFQGLPVWAFHGLEDDVVPPQQSELAIQQILEAGGFAKLTLLAGVDHNSWDYAYQESELAKWLLSHHLV
jgi:predicted peptidase